MTIEIERHVKDGVEGKPWTSHEISAVVAAYFYMLRMQESGQTINKSECNRKVKEGLPARSLFSISRKHSNISAILTLHGVQTLHGYKPLFNYQKALAEEVERVLGLDTEFDSVALRRVQSSVEVPIVEDYSSLLVPPPIGMTEEQEGREYVMRRIGVQRDYLARETFNRSIGIAGEQIVLEFEKAHLISIGHPELANRVEHVSRTQGDGLGFDILSYCSDGTTKHIEVKTTSYGIHTPIFVSLNEVEQSLRSSDSFWVYRVFNLRSRPKLYIIKGHIAESFALEAISFRGRLRSPDKRRHSTN